MGLNDASMKVFVVRGMHSVAAALLFLFLDATAVAQESLAIEGAALAPAGQAAEPTVASVATPQRVVFVQLEGEAVRSGLEPSLRIQLRGEAEVETQRVDWSAQLPARIEAAGQLANQTGADWVVWAEPPVDPERDAPRDYALIYLVGRRDGRALVEVVRVPGNSGPDVDRSLALKVHELISQADGAAYALGNAPVPDPALAKAAAQKPKPARERRVQLWLEAGVQTISEGNAGLAADVLVALGPSFAAPRFVLAVPLELSLGLPRSVERSAGEVRWTELGVAAWVRLLARVGSKVLLGGGVGGKLDFSSSDGIAPSGRRGSARDMLPALLVSLDAELLITSQIGARFLLGLAQRTSRQRLLVEGTEIADTGRTLPFARLSMALHF